MGGKGNVFVIIQLLVILSFFSLAIETFSHLPIWFKVFLDYSEIVIVVVFTVEYVACIWGALIT